MEVFLIGTAVVIGLFIAGVFLYAISPVLFGCVAVAGAFVLGILFLWGMADNPLRH